MSSPRIAASCSGPFSADSCGSWAICFRTTRQNMSVSAAEFHSSNTNQLWGLLWAILVFHELHGLHANVYAEVIGGSFLMAAGAVAIALSSASESEYSSWKEAAQRETRLYGINPEYVRTRMEGRDLEPHADSPHVGRLASCRRRNIHLCRPRRNGASSSDGNPHGMAARPESCDAAGPAWLPVWLYGG